MWLKATCLTANLLSYANVCSVSVAMWLPLCWNRACRADPPSSKKLLEIKEWLFWSYKNVKNKIKKNNNKSTDILFRETLNCLFCSINFFQVDSEWLQHKGDASEKRQWESRCSNTRLPIVAIVVPLRCAHTYAHTRKRICVGAPQDDQTPRDKSICWHQKHFRNIKKRGLAREFF